jgi:hypothetical protein
MVDVTQVEAKFSRMLSAAIRELLRAAPFEPFVVQMTDGRRFEVPHPDFAALSPNGAQLFVFRSDADGAGITLSTMLVASVERLRPAAH